MEKINFSNGEKISAAKVTIDNVDYEVTPAEYDGATPLNATVFNNMQENIENAIDEKADSEDVYEKTETYTKTEVNNLIPTKAHQVNVGTEVDEEYRVNLLKTKNLCDKQNISTTYWESSNNKILYDSTNKSYSIYISIKPNTTYTISKATAGHTFRVATTEAIPYSIAGTPVISTTANHTGTSITITTESTAKYLWVVFFNTNNGDTGSYTEVLNTLQVEEGNTATDYEPFIPNQINVDNEKYSDTINVGIIEDSRSRVNFIYGTNLFNKNDVLTNKYVDPATGEIASSNGRISSNYISVEPNTDYVFSSATDFSTNGKGIAFYNSSKTFISGTSFSNLTGNKITTPANTSYMIFSYDNSSTQFNNIILQKGNKPIVPSIKVDNEEIYNKGLSDYSTNEQRIGTWIDGKPLYRKCFEKSSLAVGDNTISTGLNIDTLVRLDCNLYRTNGIWHTLTFANSSNMNATMSISYQVSGTISINIGSAITNASKCYVIMEYTKS